MNVSVSGRARVALTGLIIVAFASVIHGERLPIRVYTAADGLGSSVILHIASDSRGFLWLATRNGLSRFDGSEFRTYTTEDGLPDPVINQVLETREDGYWVATNGGGVCRFNVDAAPVAAVPLFTCFKIGDDFLSNRVNVMRQDRHRRIWLGTDGALFRMERAGATWRIDPVVLAGVAGVRTATSSIHEDAQGRLWIALDAGLLRVDLDGRMAVYRLEIREQLAARTIADRNGVVWAGFRFGLLGFRPAATLPAAERVHQLTLRAAAPCLRATNGGLAALANDGDVCLSDDGDGLPATFVQSLLHDARGRLWIATAGGGLAAGDGVRLTTLRTVEARTEGYQRLAQDREGHIWIATALGAMRLAPTGLVSYGVRDGLGHSRVHRLFEHSRAGIFAVSGDWVINRFDGVRFHAATARAPAGAILTYYSHGALLDSRDRWWLLTDRGLVRLRAGVSLEDAARQPPETVFDTRSGLASANVVRAFEDSRGDIWIATRKNGVPNLHRWTRANDAIETFRDGLGAAHELPMAFAEDHRGAVWIGFEGAGLARFWQGRFAAFGAADGVPANLTSLHVDRAGTLWIGSASAGVSELRDVTADAIRLSTYTTAQGLSTNNVQCMTDDAWGRLYLGTARGIDRLDLSTGHVRHFTTRDGLSGDYVTSALRARDDTLWFGTTDGLSRLVPEPEARSRPSPVWIGDVRAGGTPHALPPLGSAHVTGITLGPGQNHLQIGFFGVGFSTGGALRYRYRLDSESEWSGPTDRRVVHYAGLGPGSYRFMVEGVNADGVASDAPASVWFTVQPPVWQRAWFLGLSAALVGALAFAWHRARVRRVVELERVRARIAGDLHDDIGGTLSRIAIQSEVARRDALDPDGAPARRLIEIGDTARGVVESLGDVVWSVDPGQDDLGSVERRLREYAADILGARGVRWTFHGTGHAGIVALDPERRRDLLLLLKEGVTNIARHADARVASLHLRLADGELHAELRDDGRGFDTAPRASGLTSGRGLANMRRRAERLGGALAVESSPGSGTRFVLKMPLGRRRRMYMRLRKTVTRQNLEDRS